MITIIDYGAGNLRSVAKAIVRLGYQATVSSNPQSVADADIVILPGVGAAGDTMESLMKLGMVEPIKTVIRQKKPFLGICLGLQVLLTRTEESGGYDCLDLIKGAVRLLPSDLKVPQMGWNQVKQQITHPVFDGIPHESNFYFVHSYYVDPSDASVVAGITNYGIDFCSMIITDNMVATQFHPEKSGEVGLRMLSNFLKMHSANA